MAQFVGKAFQDEAVSLDGNEYDGCVFRRCTLVYMGIADVKLANSEFDSCRWQFDGAAKRTLQFLHALHGGGWAPMVEQLVREITDQGLSKPATTH